MESAIYVNTLTNQARNGINGPAVPVITPMAQTHLKLQVYFFEPNSPAALLDDDATFRVALVDKADVTNVLALLTAPTETAEDHYVFEWASLNRASLVALLGDKPAVDAVLVIVWIVGGKTERVVIPVSITNGYLRDDATEPDLVPFLARVTALGYLEVQLPDGTWFNWGGNVGRAPTI